MKYEQFSANTRKAYGDACEIGGMLSHIKQVLAAVPDLVGKNERLEKENRELKGENARLRAELDDWIGNAEGFEPDAYMKLPVDADGVPVRIGDDVNVDAAAMTVVGYRRHGGMMRLIAKDKSTELVFDPVPSEIRHFKPEPADSWEKLEEDAKQRICSYFGVDQENTSCEDCPYGSSQTGRLCWQNASLDMIARAKKLAGIEEEAER